jgi:hypothetical protein
LPIPFRAAVESHDFTRVAGLLHDDVVFRSPAVYKPYRGKGACSHLLRHVEQVFTDFRYVDEIDGGDRAALVFEASVDGKELMGLDHLRFDADGKVTELTVMIRPLSGLVALATAMSARLEQDPVPTG